MAGDQTFSVFILKSQAHSLTQAETFLRNRKWTVHSSINLKEALAYIIQKQPQYIFISADHPNKKVRVLPKMLAQAFPVKVIGFNEKSGSDSGRLLTALGLEYSLYSPVSGPAMERIVLKVIRDEETKKEQAADPQRTHSSGSSGAGSDSITLKGGNSVNEEEQKRSFEQARAALAQMMNSDVEGESPAKSGVIIQKGANQNIYSESQGSTESSQNFQEWEEEQKRKREAGFTQQEGVGPGLDHYMPEHDEQGSRKPSPLATEDPAHGSNTGSAVQSGAPGNNLGSLNQENPFNKANGSFGGTPAASHSATESSVDYKTKDAKASPVMEADYIRKKQKQARYFSDAQKNSANDSIIVRGTQEALDKSINVTGADTATEIETSTNVACITIESPRFSGYLICALAEDQKVDQTLIDLINKRLLSFLKENGEPVKDQDPMEIKIQSVDFIDWSIEQAQFLKKSVHNGREIAMAFFPHKEMKTTFEVSEDKMIKLQLDELKADVPVEFDLYIYMPENNKYILYTPEGGNLYGGQKKRLESKGVKHMHVRDTALQGLKKYQAQNYLNEQIDIYKDKRKVQEVA